MQVGVHSVDKRALLPADGDRGALVVGVYGPPVFEDLVVCAVYLVRDAGSAVEDDFAVGVGPVVVGTAVFFVLALAKLGHRDVEVGHGRHVDLLDVPVVGKRRGLVARAVRRGLAVAVDACENRYGPVIGKSHGFVDVAAHNAHSLVPVVRQRRRAVKRRRVRQVVLPVLAVIAVARLQPCQAQLTVVRRHDGAGFLRHGDNGLDVVLDELGQR